MYLGVSRYLGTLLLNYYSRAIVRRWELRGFRKREPYFRSFYRIDLRLFLLLDTSTSFCRLLRLHRSWDSRVINLLGSFIPTQKAFEPTITLIITHKHTITHKVYDLPHRTKLSRKCTSQCRTFNKA